jgi:hypothetical protein
MLEKAVKPFKKTPKQVEITRLIHKHKYMMSLGGSRSGKTFIKMRNILVRAGGMESRHLVVRKTQKSIRGAIWNETLPKVFKLCFPHWINGRHYVKNERDLSVKFCNGSSIWLGGMEDGENMEKILGREYSTIFANECSELNFSHIEMLKTRLAENAGMARKFLFDQNPPSTKHWSYKLFVLGINPADDKPLIPDQLRQYGMTTINPEDNKENLTPDYFDTLESLGKRKRDRFLLGLFASDIQGALWNNQMINSAQLTPGEEWIKNPLQTIVSLDPNVSDGVNEDTGEFTADEAGIIVISKDGKNRDAEGCAQVEADYSGEYSAPEWADKAIWAYYYHNADYIIYEKNQGGALVKMALRAAKGGALVPIKDVWASKGKHARAEPVVVLYEQQKIRHKPGLDKLEAEQLEYVPAKTKKSPNRLDALVWGATYLFLKDQPSGDIPLARAL